MIRFATFTRRAVAKGSAAILLGFLAGASVTVLAMGYKMDRLTLDNIALKEELTRLETQVKQLEKTWWKWPIKDVDVRIRGVDDEHLRLRFKSKVQDLLSPLIGEQSDRIKPQTIDLIVRRTLVIDNQEYSLEPTYIWAEAPVFVVEVTVREGGSHQRE